MVTIVTKVVKKYYRPQDLNTIKYYVTAKFDEYNTINTDGKLSPRSKLSQDELKSERNKENIVSISHQKYSVKI